MNAIRKIAAVATSIVLAGTIAACSGNTDDTIVTESPEPTVTATAGPTEPTQAPEPTSTPEPPAPVPGDQVRPEDVEALREQGMSVYVSPAGTAVVVDPADRALPEVAAADVDALVGVTASTKAELDANGAALVAVARSLKDAGLGVIIIMEGMRYVDGVWSPMDYVAAGMGTAKGACRDTGGPVSRGEAEAVAAECAAATGFQVFDLTK